MIGGVHHEDGFLANPGDFRVNVSFLKVAGQSAALNVASPFLEDPSGRHGESGRVWRLHAMSFSNLFFFPVGTKFKFIYIALLKQHLLTKVVKAENIK